MDTLPNDDFTNDMHVNEQLNKPIPYLTASSIMGDKVHDENDAKMGDIKDIMIDVATGKIEYYIIEFGGFLGIGIKYFAIPFNLLRIDSEKKIFIFTQSKEVLSNAPGFNYLHWPETNYHVVVDYWRFV